MHPFQTKSSLGIPRWILASVLALILLAGAFFLFVLLNRPDPLRDRTKNADVQSDNDPAARAASRVESAHLAARALPAQLSLPARWGDPVQGSVGEERGRRVIKVSFITAGTPRENATQYSDQLLAYGWNTPPLGSQLSSDNPSLNFKGYGWDGASIFTAVSEGTRVTLEVRAIDE